MGCLEAMALIAASAHDGRKSKTRPTRFESFNVDLIRGRFNAA
jgi:hypothetical protein